MKSWLFRQINVLKWCHHQSRVSLSWLLISAVWKCLPSVEVCSLQVASGPWCTAMTTCHTLNKLITSSHQRWTLLRNVDLFSVVRTGSALLRYTGTLIKGSTDRYTIRCGFNWWCFVSVSLPDNIFARGEITAGMSKERYTLFSPLANETPVTSNCLLCCGLTNTTQRKCWFI